MNVKNSQTLKAVGVIPARLGSTRLEEKVLREIDGRPMVQRVWERASQAKGLAEVIVATDDARVEACVKAFGGKAVLTRRDHPNGTSRVAEIAEKSQADIFVNIQGDEPLIHPEAIQRLVAVFQEHPEVQVATLGVRLQSREDYENPNVVKLVTDAVGNALYFSRAPMPHFRKGTDVPFSFVKHLGIYAYRRDFLLRFVRWPSSTLEETEKLEQLRILENGHKIFVCETQYDSLSVDTKEDLEMVEAVIRNQSKKAGVL